MGDDRSLLARFTTVAGRVGTILVQQDTDLLDRADLKLVGTIKQLLADARLDIRDYEMAETRADMRDAAIEALSRIDQARDAILLASERGMFSAIDIAELMAHFDHIASEMRGSAK